jgi:hypothetical protein
MTPHRNDIMERLVRSIKSECLAVSPAADLPPFLLHALLACAIMLPWQVF